VQHAAAAAAAELQDDVLRRRLAGGEEPPRRRRIRGLERTDNGFDAHGVLAASRSMPRGQVNAVSATS
jgi:hypothetical protein